MLPFRASPGSTSRWRLVLTKRQSQLLSFIKDYAVANAGVSPSFREMAAHLGTKSLSTVHWLLTALQSQGKVSYQKRKARTVEVVA